MFEIIAAPAVLSALILLIILSVIDLRDGLLPNEYVMGLAMAGAVFHLATAWHYLGLQEMALGGFIGAAFLYLVREIANKIYKQDALGLGDVKLLGAAGIWLGPYYILDCANCRSVCGIAAWAWPRIADEKRHGHNAENECAVPARRTGLCGSGL
jgi:prepilin signal peptidase PulO-like enzyme (type II secretory pathway)